MRCKKTSKSHPEEGTSTSTSKQNHVRAKSKPEAIIAYNQEKAGIDLFDQMASYAMTLRKGVKWYRKPGIELLFGMSIVNAHVVYQELTGDKIKIKNFREMIACHLLGVQYSKYSTGAAEQSMLSNR